MSDFHIIDCDTEKIYDDILTNLEKHVGEPLYPGDERRYFGEAIALLFTQMYSIADDAGKQTMLKYARGETLDAIGARLDVTRRTGKPAHCTVRFGVQTPLDQDIEIPKYTKVTSDSTHYFAIPETIILKAGTYYVESIAYATVNGEDANNIMAGNLYQLVDKVPYISSVTNIDATSGGDDGEPYTTAGDNKFRERIRVAPNKLSCAGPRGAYQYWGLTSTDAIRDLQCVSEHEIMRTNFPVISGRLFIGGSHLDPDTLVIFDQDGKISTDYTKDYTNDLLTVTLGNSIKGQSSLYVEIYRTLEGHVKIVPLLEKGKVLDAELKREILSVLDDEKIRPMTDFVEVEAPHEVTFDIELSYTVTPGTEKEMVEKIEDSGGAVDQYIEWQTSKLGRDINPDTLRQLIISSAWTDGLINGALNVEIVSPTLKELDNTEVAVFSGKKKISHQVKTGVI